MQSKLKQVERREKILDWMFVGIFSAFLVACFVVTYRWEAPTGSIMANAAAALFTTVIAGYPVVHVLNALDKYVRRRWVTSYCIEEGDGVLKVFGAIPLKNWEFVRSQLLAIRPNYRLVDDAYKSFGCTMAAIPASEAYLNARREFEAHGLSI